MFRIFWFLLGLLVTLSAEAKINCDAIPEVDINATPNSISLNQTGRSLLVINSDNSITIQGVTRQTTAAVQQQAAQLRELINTTLPWVSQSGLAQLNASYLALDKVISDTLGKQSKLHPALADLHTQLQQQFQQIIGHKGDNWFYRYSALADISAQSEKLLNANLAALIQSSLQDLGESENTQGSSMLAMLNKVAELQNAMQQSLKQQQQQLQKLATQVCQRATAVEAARKRLYQSLDL